MKKQDERINNQQKEIYDLKGRLDKLEKKSSLDDLVEFRADGIYAKETWTMRAPYWPAYVIHKGDRLLIFGESK
jgi:hypothetical protein